MFLGPDFGSLNQSNDRKCFYRILRRLASPGPSGGAGPSTCNAARTTVYARGAAAGIPVDQMMTFVGHRDIRTAMRHYRDPDATSTQAIVARLAAAGEQAAHAPVAGRPLAARQP